MATASRPKFTTFSDWHQFVIEQRQLPPEEAANLYELRKNCYSRIEELRGRPLIVYAVQFPNDHPRVPISIDQVDVDGFTDLIAATESESVDVLLHSPGGSPEATERIVALLRTAFNTVNFLIPHSAFSAATMLAFSGNEIVLHPSACLGPIDPQINGTPARSIKRGFERIRDLLKQEGPEALPAYIPLIEKYSIELLEVCDDAENLSKELAKQWLTEFMFSDDDAASKNEVIERAVDYFSSYDLHKTHSRPITFNKLQPLSLKITVAESDLRDLLREAHILISGLFSLTSFVKVYENSHGLTWGRQFEVQVGKIQIPQPQSQPQISLPNADFN